MLIFVCINFGAYGGQWQWDLVAMVFIPIWLAGSIAQHLREGKGASSKPEDSSRGVTEI